MASGKASNRARVLEWLAEQRVDTVTESVWRDLATAFPTVKERVLRHAVRDSGLPMSPLVEGVRQSSLAELFRTLVALQHEYEAVAPRSDRRRMVRSVVLEARTRAKFSAPKNAEKAEMVQWMLVWLEDPALFETWARLRMVSLRNRDAGEVPYPDADQADANGKSRIR